MKTNTINPGSFIFSIFVLLFSIIVYSSTNAQSYIISTFAGNGVPSYSGDGGAATAAEINGTFGIASDSAGNIYLADQNNNRVRKVNTSGIISTVAGNGIAGYNGDGGQATAAELYFDNGVGVDYAGNFYITDNWNQVVRKVNTSTGVITTIAGNGYGRGSHIGGYSGDGGQATAAELNDPSGVVIDRSGYIYITDWDGNRVRMVNTSGIISTIAGNGIQGYSGDGGAATDAELYSPWGITLDASGNVFIADWNNNRIRMVNTSGIISTVAGNGIANYFGDGGAATAAELDNPSGVTFDILGNLYVTDDLNNRVRMVNTSGIISSIAGNGIASFSGDGGPATAAEMNYPNGIASNKLTGNLYISDQDDYHVRRLYDIDAGVNEFKTNTNLVNVYPNPGNGKFTIVFTNPTLCKTMIEVYSIVGQEIFIEAFQPVQNENIIDLSTQPNGVYFYRVVTNSDNLIGEGKLIIEK